MKKRSTSFLSVFLILAFVLGIPVALAANMPHSIEKSTTNIVIDGRQASVDGYNVDNGNNYVNLRDIAQSLDVSVAWDASTDTATLDTSAHYKSDPTSLITGNWAPETRARLETLIQEVKAPEPAQAPAAEPEKPAEKAADEKPRSGKKRKVEETGPRQASLFDF